MRNLFFITVLLLGSISVKSQNLYVTFAGTGDITVVDSVTATNLTTGESITLPGSETLVLSGITGRFDFNKLQEFIQLFPNPSQGTASLSFIQETAKEINITIRNLMGQVKYQSSFYLEAGEHTFKLSFDTPGVYLIDISGKNERKCIKAICIESNGGSATIIKIGNSNEGLKQMDNNRFKSQENVYALDFTLGDVIHYKGMSGKYSTILTDSTDISQNYELEFVDCTDPDGRTYKVVKIGDQMWMAENLAYLPNVGPPTEESDTRYYYVYDYSGYYLPEAMSHENYLKYGVLYNWEAAKSACPSGWHLPTDEEWKVMEIYLGMSASDADQVNYHRKSGNVGIKLKSATGWGEGAGRAEPNGDNSSGFNALPSGILGSNGQFDGIGEWSNFWTLSPYDSNWIWSRGLTNFWSFPNVVLRNESLNLRYGYSVRCLRNDKYPTVMTSRIRHITDSVAMGGGNVLYNSETEILERGICWSTSEEPIITDNKTIDGNRMGEYTCNLSSLEPGTTYYTKAYVTTNDGNTFYGDQVPFTTADGSFTDDRDGKTYGFITIGTQNWMNENLAFLPAISPPSVASYVEEHFYVHGYESSTVSIAKNTYVYDTYGVLYNWEAAKNACSAGWHLPTDDEWKTLERYMGISEEEVDDYSNYRESGEVGMKLKSKVGWGFQEGNIGIDSEGFNAIPGGAYFYSDYYGNGEFSGANHGLMAGFWSSTPYYSSDAYWRVLDEWFLGIGREVNDKRHGFSVRCVQGESEIMVITSNVTNITGTSATLGGYISNPGHDDEVIVRGTCLSNEENPTTSDWKRIDGSGTGEYSSTLSNLVSGTTYYVRAYATTNNNNTHYGNQVAFKTVSGIFTDARDGRSYDYITIGTQTWMMENLAYLPKVNDWQDVSYNEPFYYVNQYRDSSVTEAKATENYQIYGVLYNWEAAKTACPDGWHLPSEEEWETLKDHLGGWDVAGGKMKETGIEHWDIPNPGTNSSGFTALPGGGFKRWVEYDMEYYNRFSPGRNVTFWSSTTWWRDLHSYGYKIWNHFNQLSREEYDQSSGFSVRCLKD